MPQTTPVVAITIEIDGITVDSPSANSFRYDWDTSLHGNGPHTIDVKVGDLDENERTVSRQATVDNSSGTTSVPYSYSAKVLGIEIGSQCDLVPLFDDRLELD
jgi:hypothetical protein